MSAPSTTARDALILSEHLRTATPPSRLEIVRPSVEIDRVVGRGRGRLPGLLPLNESGQPAQNATLRSRVATAVM